jgi:integrase
LLPSTEGSRSWKRSTQQFGDANLQTKEGSSARGHPSSSRRSGASAFDLQITNRTRDLGLFDLAIDSKLRACDLVRLRVHDVCHGDRVAARAIVMQRKTQRPVQFEITEQTREAVLSWVSQARLRLEDYLFPSRPHDSPHLSTRQYARIVDGWVREIGLDPAPYGTHTLRRTKASLVYRRTKNLRAVQRLLGHSKLESTLRYLGIEVDDALEMAEQTDV